MKSPSFSVHLQAIGATAPCGLLHGGPTPTFPDPGKSNCPQETVFKTGSQTRAESGDAIQTFVSRSWVTVKESEMVRQSGLTCSEQMWIPCSIVISHKPPENKNSWNTPPDGDNDVNGPHVTQQLLYPPGKHFEVFSKSFWKRGKK